MSPKDFEALVRNQINLITTPGPIANAVVERIVSNAQDAAPAFVAEEAPLLALSYGTLDALGGKEKVLASIRGVRRELDLVLGIMHKAKEE